MATLQKHSEGGNPASPAVADLPNPCPLTAS